ncbi:hypothetical protein [Rhizobium sp. RCAM05973]|uniref:hypothetical protein n=1 Tax=Rhizobium sp. RCAM05973 TaxID=2994066 RepID=UPI0022EBD98B|nr:hypothetical protein [Rhizobium sp. RCAM05973]
MMEFSVILEPENIGGDWLLKGRCITDLFVNGRFTELVRFDFPENGTQENLPIEGETWEVDLKIEKISAYQHEFEKINAGMTAAVTVSGDGEKLASNWLAPSKLNVCVLRGRMD